MNFQENVRSDLQLDMDMLALSQCAGITINPRVLRVLVKLLEMNVHPTVIHQVLQKICSRRPTSNSHSRTGSIKNPQLSVVPVEK